MKHKTEDYKLSAVKYYLYSKQYYKCELYNEKLYKYII